MISREDFLKEQLLRDNIRRAIRIVKERNIKQENYVRTIIKNIISEATTFKYEYTSLNQLAHFIKEVVGDPSKPDSNPAFKDAYTDLSSDHNDREQFVEFIIDFADEDFKTIDADREPQPLGQDFVEKGFSDPEEEEEEEVPEEEGMVKLSIQDLEDSGGDLTQQPEEEEEEDEIFSIGEDGDIVEDAEDEFESNKRFARESYKRIGPSLRRYYLNVPKNSPIKKAVQIDGKEYQSGDLSERDLFKIYFKKNMALWAERYEEEFFNDVPETNIDIPSEEEVGIEDVEDITQDQEFNDEEVENISDEESDTESLF
tara:strand:+ start:4787 stop:5728 length:942 start_codon:yes stop_codon:yes gene_type:complete